jgi:hypothetical protein
MYGGRGGRGMHLQQYACPGMLDGLVIVVVVSCCLLKRRKRKKLFERNYLQAF